MFTGYPSSSVVKEFVVGKLRLIVMSSTMGDGPVFSPPSPLLAVPSQPRSLRSFFHLSQSVMASTELATTTSASGTPQGPPPHSDPVEESQVVARLLEENARLRQQLNFDNKTTPEEVEEAVSDLRSSINIGETWNTGR